MILFNSKYSPIYKCIFSELYQTCNGIHLFPKYSGLASIEGFTKPLSSSSLEHLLRQERPECD